MGNMVKLTVGVFTGVVLLVGACSSYQVINPGERGIYVKLGKASAESLGEGLHLKMPFISSIRTISTRIQKSEAGSEAATKDMQRISAVLALNWSISPENVVQMFRDFGDEHAIHERIIKPAVSEVLKASTAKMTAEEVLTKRLELKQHIDEQLVTRLATYNVLVKDVSLVDLNFTNEFNHAVEEKQIAEQNAKKAEYVAQQATANAKATINTARGDAESKLIMARAQAESQKLLQYTLTKDVLALEYLKKWDGQLPTVMSGNGNGLMLNLMSTSTRSKAKTESSNGNEE